MVRNEALPAVDLYVTRDTGDRTDGTDGPGGTDGNRGSTATGPTGETGRDSRANEFGGFTAFAGVAGDMLEMLFVAPGMRGKGFGRQLVNHITRHCGVRRVDVNEQNPQAAGFYERMGFRTAGRIELMAGSGVNPSNVRQLAATGVDAVHFSARSVRPGGMVFRNPHVSMGGCGDVSEYDLLCADERLIRQILTLLEP